MRKRYHKHIFFKYRVQDGRLWWESIQATLSDDWHNTYFSISVWKSAVKHQHTTYRCSSHTSIQQTSAYYWRIHCLQTNMALASKVMMVLPFWFYWWTYLLVEFMKTGCRNAARAVSQKLSLLWSNSITSGGLVIANCASSSWQSKIAFLTAKLTTCSVYVWKSFSR